MNARILTLLVVTLIPGFAAADTLFTYGASEPGSTLDGGFFNIGNEFTVGGTPLQTTKIGAFVNTSDVSAGGLTINPFTANLYVMTGADTGTLIASLLIPVNTPVDSQGFAYAPLTENLATNTNYVVSDFRGTAVSPASSTPFGYSGGGFPNPGISIGTFGPGTTFVENRYNSDPNPADFPSSNNGGFQQFLGGNLQYVATPEPSSLILCVLGAIGLFIAARHRRV